MIFSLFSSMAVFLYVGAVSMYYAQNELATFVEIAHAYAFMFGLSILLLVHYTIHLKSTQELLKLIDSGVFEYDTKYGEEEDNKFRKTMEFYNSIFKNVFRIAIWVAYTILVIFAPLLVSFTGEGNNQRLNEITYNLPVPLWMPFDMNTTLGYSLGYSLVCFNIGLIILYLSASIPFIVFVAFEVNIQYGILKRSILGLEHRALEKYIGYCGLTEPQKETLRDDPIFVRCVQDSMKENILHHLEIVRLFDMYQDVTSSIFGVAIGVSMTILASLTIVLTKVNLLSVEALKFSFMYLVEVMVVFGYCLMGTFLTSGSQQIETALYNCPWYNLHESQKKIFRIFQFRSSSSIELKGSGLFLINLQLFVQILQTTYSIFNIFSSMDGGN
ncbi:hypothetical protein LSTR_LSTR007174 [Laodelphax striatellus]|uniref:Odorant receptor n=1 Tax=Laodelphax striatellus TaxID=195883 RepID=A0A482WWY9_LAOST|nr:hypothetical protein LSTR_LSTR007174 [Laodelphax striatellus]